MPSISVLLSNVHKNVPVFNMKLNYSEPKIYTGGVDIKQWSKLSTKEKKAALRKHWYVYYYFRHPVSGRLVKQPHIKGGANRFKDKAGRYHILKHFQTAITIVLQEGFNPYGENGNLKEYLKNREKRIQGHVQTPPQKIRTHEVEPSTSIMEAFKTGLQVKENVLGQDSFKKFKSRVIRFQKWLTDNGITPKTDITSITKKTVIRYLNHVLQETSPRNRNNTRTDLSSLFQTLEDNEIIEANFIKKINVLRAIPTRHKSYTPELLEKIDAYLKENDKVLRLFIQFISYNFLRPIEVCRLRVKDIDLTDRKLYVKAKNQQVKTKMIPQIMIDEMPDISKYKKDDHLFNMNRLGGIWTTNESNKRDYYTKRFKKVKDHFKLGTDYSMYSFRHTYIGKLYRELEKHHSPNEAKSRLMHITGHSSMRALESYLREIDASLPKDYSQHLK
ncbi:tyrosine-type recombinase/integrase [Maribacter thermophilus]|uniref:tyrosine-type recombinase/integrase n=1 Tax=Maribacter thermophilus TaxID=1197874 RepID=UPI0006412F71|nr:site-specific integrase [Maribacter thermophilus]